MKLFEVGPVTFQRRPDVLNFSASIIQHPDIPDTPIYKSTSLAARVIHAPPCSLLGAVS